MNREANPEILLFRTFSRAPEKEFEILSNNRKDDNILTTPSTLIIPEIRFSSISSMQETENRWKNKPNLVFQPTTKESLSRTGTTMVLCCPASLHTCRTGDLITHYDAENKAITKPLFKRFKEFAEYLKTEWEKDATRDGKNLGMYDKYTELPLHDDLQGKQLYEQGYDFIDSIKKAIPEKGHELYKYVIQETEKNISKEKQDKIFESHKKYTKFLNNTNKTNLSPNIIKACKKYEDYLKNFTGNLPESYFDIIGDELYQGMRQEIIDSYEKYINNGLRHNEFIGRLFPWEIRSIEIGHVNNKQDKKDVLKHIQIANKNCQEFVELRKNLLKEIEVDGFGCYLIKEFIDAKNDILSHNNQDKLSDDEKVIILNSIKKQLNQNIYVSSYQNGVFEKIDLPSDSIVFNPKGDLETLNENTYNTISNRLRGMAGLPIATKHSDIKKNNDNNDAKMLQHARNAVKAFLETGIEFNLTGSKEDSGALAIHLLRERYPELNDREIVEQNVDNFSIDTCMSTISSACYLNEELKAKYEFNSLDIKLESENYATAILDYGKTVTRSYTDKNKFLNEKRPLISYSVNGYTLPFNKMQKETQKNLMEVWSKRHNNFKKRIEIFIEKINVDYNLDLSIYLKNNHIDEVLIYIKEQEKKMFGDKGQYPITRQFFKVLGGAYNRSLEIKDEQYFRENFPKEQWLQNPHGKQYRQHETGRGALTTIAPSEESIQIFETEIKKGRKPFKSSEDLEYILGKIDNPIDRFGLKAIVLNESICAAPSGTAIRMMNLWDEICEKIKNNPKLSSLSKPNSYQMEQLCINYLCGSKNHHTKFEVESVLRNRRRNIAKPDNERRCTESPF